MVVMPIRGNLRIDKQEIEKVTSGLAFNGILHRCNRVGPCFVIAHLSFKALSALVVLKFGYTSRDYC